MRALRIALCLAAVLPVAGCDWYPRNDEDCCAPPPARTVPTHEASRFGMLTASVRGVPRARELKAGDTLRTLVPQPDALRDKDPALEPIPSGSRRFGFILAGCMDDGARLTVRGRTLQASLVRDDPTVTVACAQAVYYYAVFDVPARSITDPVRFAP